MTCIKVLSFLSNNFLSDTPRVKLPFGEYRQKSASSITDSSRVSGEHTIHKTWSDTSIGTTERGIQRLREDSNGSDIAVIIQSAEEYR